MSVTKLPLGEAVEIMRTGSTPLTSHPEYFNGSIPWFTPGDIGEIRNLVKSVRCIAEEGLKAGKAKLFEREMLLVTCIGDIGRVGVLQQPSSANQQITALKFRDNIDVYYAYYWFIAHKYKLEKLANQAIVPILNNERLEEVEFFYPPFPEQRRIAGLLARADRLRRLRRYARQLGDSYLQSVFVEMFGDVGRNLKDWERSFIDDVVAFSQYGTSNKSNSENRGYPVLGMANITYNGRLDLHSLSYVELSDKEYKELRLERGDIIFNRTNSKELVGKTAYWNCDFDAVIASYLVKLSLNSRQMYCQSFLLLY